MPDGETLSSWMWVVVTTNGNKSKMSFHKCGAESIFKSKGHFVKSARLDVMFHSNFLFSSRLLALYAANLLALQQNHFILGF